MLIIKTDEGNLINLPQNKGHGRCMPEPHFFHSMWKITSSFVAILFPCTLVSFILFPPKYIRDQLVKSGMAELSRFLILNFIYCSSLCVAIWLALRCSWRFWRKLCLHQGRYLSVVCTERTARRRIYKTR